MRTPPYLPFLDGPPGIAPGLKPIAPEAWLLPDTEAAAWLAPKRDLMRTRRSEVFAAQEAEAEMAEAATAVLAVAGPAAGDWPTPLEAAASTVSDDLCLMVRDTEGLWRLKAASLCAPTFWRLEDKIGQPLAGLHAPVPGGDPGLAARISRIFDGLQQGRVLERFNWTVQAGSERFTPGSGPLKGLATTTPDAAALDVLHLRVERQTIQKLPETGALLFTIRIVIDPLCAALLTPRHVEAFTAAWQGVDPAMHRYKGWPAYDRLVGAALDGRRNPVTSRGSRKDEAG
jgi:Haem-dependent oxidative N-demethylase, alpha subunit-like